MTVNFMENAYTVDILTPDRILVKDLPALSLLVPTTRGQINVLGNHTHIITKLSNGLLSVFGGPDDADRHFMVTTGICKVLGCKIHVLAHVLEESHGIDAERAKRALANAERILSSRDDLSDEEIFKYRNKVERAHLRIQIAKRSGD